MNDSLGILPKKIYSLWFQGLESAPPLVRWNFDRWMELNPKYEFILLDEKTSLPYLSELKIDLAQITPQAKSDIIRLKILREHGGIWTDASVVPLQPLDDWINGALEKTDFFAFEREGVVLPMSSWFLAAKPNAVILEQWCALVQTYWSVERAPVHVEGQPHFVPLNPMASMAPFNPERRTDYPYFWLHHLFGVLLQTNTEFAQAWEQRCRISSRDAHCFARHFNRQYKPRKNLKKVAHQLQRALGFHGIRSIKEVSVGTKMQKLDWRIKYPPAVFDGFAQTPFDM
jgi:hypothetical protein